MNLKNYIKAGVQCIQLVTQEDGRAVREIENAIASIGKPRRRCSWSVSGGMMDSNSNVEVSIFEEGSWKPAKGKTKDPLNAIQWVRDVQLHGDTDGQATKGPVVVMKDFHLYFKQPNPMLIALFKDCIGACRKHGGVIIIIGCSRVSLPELEKYITFIEMPLPDHGLLENVVLNSMDAINKRRKPAPPKKARGRKAAEPEAKPEEQGVIETPGPLLVEPPREPAIEVDVHKATKALLGLTETEAEDAIFYTYVNSKKVCPEALSVIKIDNVKRNKMIDIVSYSEKEDEIGGLGNVKAWMLKRAKAFGNEEAKKFGITSPRGMLVIGISGTGKSMIAKSVANTLKVPMLRVDGGKIFGKFVGDSELNMRQALAVADAMSPCVLFIDEMEKAMAGGESSGSCDGGTTSRVIGTFLQWMQDHESQVFVVATANDVSKLPPEMLRKGRFDQIFFVDLPDETEREEIWKVHIRRHGRDPKAFNTRLLATSTDGFTGAEIESIVKDGILNAFCEGKEPDSKILLDAIEETVPLSSTMKEKITNMRRWAEGRAIKAS